MRDARRANRDHRPIPGGGLRVPRHPGERPDLGPGHPKPREVLARAEGVGTRTRMELSLLGRTATYDWEVTEYEPPRLLAYRTTSGPLPATVRFRLVPVDGGTRLAHAVETEPRGVYYRALASLMPGAIGRILEGMLGNLKDRLAGKPATASREPGAAPSGAMVGAIVVAAVAVASLLLLRRRRRSGKR